MHRDKEHIAALDGIRGIAILLVLLVHFIPPVAMQWRTAEWIMKLFSTGGWIGVDLFFVLSGFLITRILLKTKRQPDFFLNFYMRRALRIFPLYFLALAIIFVALPYLISTERFAALQDKQSYYWLYVANVGVYLFGFDAMDSDVVSPSAYWSLAIEEQFYLIWPAVIFVSSTRSIKQICLAIIVSAFLIRCVGVLALGEANTFFYLTPCRMDGLAAGALVATILHEQGASGLRRLMLPLAIAAIAAAGLLLVFFLLAKGFWVGHWFMRTFGLSLLALIFSAVIVVAVAAPTGILAKLLYASPLRFFGKYSYGLYIIHALLLPTLLSFLPYQQWVELFGSQTMVGSLSLASVKIALCVPLAMLSFHFFELPFLRLKPLFETVPPTGSVAPNYSTKI